MGWLSSDAGAAVKIKGSDLRRWSGFSKVATKNERQKRATKDTGYLEERERKKNTSEDRQNNNINTADDNPPSASRRR